MKTSQVSADAMVRRTVRFHKLEAYQHQWSRTTQIPVEVLEKIAAHRVYPIMVPETYKGRSASAPLKGAPGLALTIAECPPGDGPGLHCHETTIENFFCLSGRFRIAWGDDGEDSLVLEPLDMVSVPPGVSRSFTNISGETGRLLVMIQIPTQEQVDKVAYSPQVGKEIAAQFGQRAVDDLVGIGMKFDAGLETN